jgi:DNA modification methylase
MSIEIKNGDVFDLIKSIPDESVDLILTDPPYGINHTDGFIKSSNKEVKTEYKIKGDKVGDIDWDVLLEEFQRVLKPKKMCYIFGRTDMFMRIGTNVTNSKLKYCHDFLWRKGDMNYGNLNLMGNVHELCIGLSKGSAEKSRPLIFDGEEKKRYKAEYNGKVSTIEYYGHPTQKPIGLLSYFILNRTDVGDLILDPFAGASSTLIAANNLDRNSIGFELDQTFYDLSLKRISDEEHIKICKKQISGGMSYSKCGLTEFKSK